MRARARRQRLASRTVSRSLIRPLRTDWGCANAGGPGSAACCYCLILQLDMGIRAQGEPNVRVPGQGLRDLRPYTGLAHRGYIQQQKALCISGTVAKTASTFPERDGSAATFPVQLHAPSPAPTFPTANSGGAGRSPMEADELCGLLQDFRHPAISLLRAVEPLLQPGIDIGFRVRCVHFGIRGHR
jgi:hypothetical protein